MYNVVYCIIIYNINTLYYNIIDYKEKFTITLLNCYENYVKKNLNYKINN